MHPHKKAGCQACGVQAALQHAFAAQAVSLVHRGVVVHKGRQQLLQALKQARGALGG